MNRPVLFRGLQLSDREFIPWLTVSITLNILFINAFLPTNVETKDVLVST
jgi:hypothetical protein